MHNAQGKMLNAECSTPGRLNRNTTLEHWAFGLDSGSTVRRLGPSLLVLAACTLAACATGGAVPRPFPGAALPPGAAEPAPQNPPISTPAAGDLSPTTELPPALIATALMFRGTPYRNGGSDPSGFDCSGFVQYVFAQHGRSLPREVQEQFRSGEAIDKSDVRPGDLVFFETVAHGASHVGIALGGNEFVHAPSSRGVVRIERYTLEYWSKRWVGARRVLATQAVTTD
jgi:cell wall-associated NlpC family hydrolase